MVRKVGTKREIHVGRLAKKAKTLAVSPFGDAFLVESASKPGSWYLTTTERCECPGFKFHRICSHMIAVKMALGLWEGEK